MKLDNLILGVPLAFLIGCQGPSVYGEDGIEDLASSDEGLATDAQNATVDVPETDTVASDNENPGTNIDKGAPADFFEGRWAMLINAASKQIRVPLLKSQITIARQYFLVEARSDKKNTVTTSEKLCDTQIKLETWLNKAIVPRAFSRSIPPIERHVEVVSTAPGTPWKSDDVWDVRGAVLEDIQNDQLPAGGSAERNESIPCDEAPWGSHCDQDEDGHPGLTNIMVGALNCKIYVAQRWHAQLDGEVVNADTIAGSVIGATTEQTILAATTSLCENSNLGSVSVSDVCPEVFYFKMVRLPDDATCEDVLDLTTCDEDHSKCEGDLSAPLNPKKDDPASCKG